jgi:hypothetical protein
MTRRAKSRATYWTEEFPSLHTDCRTGDAAKASASPQNIKNPTNQTSLLKSIFATAVLR